MQLLSHVMYLSLLLSTNYSTFINHLLIVEWLGVGLCKVILTLVVDIPKFDKYTSHCYLASQRSLKTLLYVIYFNPNGRREVSRHLKRQIQEKVLISLTW